MKKIVLKEKLASKILTIRKLSSPIEKLARIIRGNSKCVSECQDSGELTDLFPFYYDAKEMHDYLLRMEIHKAEALQLVQNQKRCT